MIRVPTEAEEQARHVSRQRQQLVHHSDTARGPGALVCLINHHLPAPETLVENPETVCV